MDRFWSKVHKTDDCWNWTAATNHTGEARAYGQFWFDGKLVLAHRFAYELEVGPIPDGIDTDHLCRNRLCVRPDHLEPVTRAENKRRGLQGVPVTHCKRGHEFTPESTYVQPKSGCRACHVCKKERDRKRHKALAAKEKP